jgi:hypothetical protein
MTQQTFDLAKAQQRVTAALATTHETVNAVAAHRNDLHAAMEAIEAAGMYTALPSRTAYESRNGGQSVYFYLYWQKRGDDSYEGPKGNRKTYIGCDPGEIAEARRKIENRKRWMRLREQITVLDSVLARFAYDVTRLVGDAESLAERTWEKSDLAQPANPDVVGACG